uniref:Uncharacterized protein n=1 Tax=Rhizophora mucronata TaxID=61149 RepID=A0A2P2NWA7_RHIMU
MYPINVMFDFIFILWNCSDMSNVGNFSI